MTESDWKIFKQIKAKAIELFCTRALAEFEEIIKNENDNAHNRYLLLCKIIQSRDETMQLLFDGHSRSRALLQLIAIRGEGLADEALLGKLSEDTLHNTDPERLRRR